MSIDSDAGDSAETPTALAEDLGEAIAALPEYTAFMDAKAAVEADPEAQEEIAAFEATRESYLDARQRGEADADDLRELQAAQEELHEIPVMRTYLQAQNELELRLQALNEQISAPLAIDFGEKAGGCCQD